MQTIKQKTSGVIECHELDDYPTKKAELKAVCIEWLGGIQAYDRLRRYAENAPPEDPEDAIRRMQGEM